MPKGANQIVKETYHKMFYFFNFKNDHHFDAITILVKFLKLFHVEDRFRYFVSKKNISNNQKLNLRNVFHTLPN